MSLEFLHTREIDEEAEVAEAYDTFVPYPYLTVEGVLDEELLESPEDFEEGFAAPEADDTPSKEVKEFEALTTLKEAGLIPESTPSFVEHIRRDANLAKTVLEILEADFYGQSKDGAERLRSTPLFSADWES